MGGPARYRRSKSTALASGPALGSWRKVQGSECADSLLRALARIEANRERHQIDVVILARGGGSFEDLFPFSDERLVREIVRYPIPVVSAVGHETDFS